MPSALHSSASSSSSSSPRGASADIEKAEPAEKDAAAKYLAAETAAPAQEDATTAAKLQTSTDTTFDLLSAYTTRPDVRDTLQQGVAHVEKVDSFWEQLREHAENTCGQEHAEAVAAAFREVHEKQMSDLNLEQLDLLCRDLLLRLLHQQQHQPQREQQDFPASLSMEESVNGTAASGP